MVNKLKNTSKPITRYGHVIVIPNECALDAARSIAVVADKLGYPADSLPSEYEAYPCDKDIVDYFRLIGAKPIRWDDLNFTANGVCTFRRSAGAEKGKLIAHNMNLHPHAFCRIETLAKGSMVDFVDQIIDFYIDHNHKLLIPEK